jgi:hypothetical protein
MNRKENSFFLECLKIIAFAHDEKHEYEQEDYSRFIILTEMMVIFILFKLFVQN